jgi:hypothetical protein
VARGAWRERRQLEPAPRTGSTRPALSCLGAERAERPRGCRRAVVPMTTRWNDGTQVLRSFEAEAAAPHRGEVLNAPAERSFVRRSWPRGNQKSRIPSRRLEAPGSIALLRLESSGDETEKPWVQSLKQCIERTTV